jgi:hypothetical protein
MAQAKAAEIPHARPGGAEPRARRSPALAAASARADRPQLAVVVDTEEEFDWAGPFSRASAGTTNIAAQPLAHRVFDRWGVVPTYVVGYPIATDPESVAVLGGLRDDGRAEIGAHLHPWVTPPHEEEVSAYNSYHCNLPPKLERAKIAALTSAIENAFGTRPKVFKAGRYALGPGTAEALKALGYEVDCSVVPYFSFEQDGGPSFRRAPDRPYWLDRERSLLEVPFTAGFYGRLAGAGPAIQGLFDSAAAKRLHVPGVLARSGLVTRVRLSPEGASAEEQCRLLDSLLEIGHRFFTLAYHSPSLAPGHTPYVRSAEDLDRFLATLDTVLAYFSKRLGGGFTTLTRYRSALLEGAESA